MEDEFFEYLLKIDASDIRVYAQKEGSVVFPRVPLLRLEGPLATVQLLETTLLCLVNYASLVATNAARHRLVAGEDVMLLEFGLRRAQGVDGGVSASRYAYLGGFDATSNVEAGRQFGIPIKGTHAHSYVQSHSGWDCVKNPRLKAANGSTCEDFPALVMEKMKRLEAVRDDMEPDLRWNETNTSELAAFTSYALAFPSAFLALVDTYNVLQSGLPNFCAVALALRELGYAAVGIRLDSGDLSYLSKCSRAFLRDIERLLGTKIADNLSKVSITASNDIHEEVLFSLKQHGHEIDAFGIGTHLVTCLKQPALGCVYKLVEVDETPRIKLSEDLAKVTIPGCKNGYRLFSQTGEAIVDVMTRVDEPAPKVGERMLCRHPFLESKRAYVVPSKIQPLFTCVWDGKRGAPADLDLSLETSRALQRSHQATAIGSSTIHESDAIQGERLGKAVRFHSRSLARRSAGGRAALGKVVFCDRYIHSIFLLRLLYLSIRVVLVIVRRDVSRRHLTQRQDFLIVPVVLAVAVIVVVIIDCQLFNRNVLLWLDVAVFTSLSVSYFFDEPGERRVARLHRGRRCFFLARRHRVENSRLGSRTMLALFLSVHLSRDGGQIRHPPVLDDRVHSRRELFVSHLELLLIAARIQAHVFTHLSQFVQREHVIRELRQAFRHRLRRSRRRPRAFALLPPRRRQTLILH